MTHSNIENVVIIGSGPAGYTAAIYTARAGLKPLLIEGMQPGGQLTTTTIVENYPGFAEGIGGTELMQQMRTQAERFGTRIQWGNIVGADFTNRPFTLTDDEGNTILAHSVIIATGATAKYLGIEGEKEFAGRGVSACATCDGYFFRGRTVAVVGGGDTAIEEALYLASLAAKVYLIVRRNVLRASTVMQQRLAANNKIEVLYEHQAIALHGSDKLERVTLAHRLGTKDETRRDINIDGFFLAIGHRPNTDIFTPAVLTDEQGYIEPQYGTQSTNIDGVFVCGDVSDPRYRQAITAAASGCRAAIDTERWLQERNITA